MKLLFKIGTRDHLEVLLGVKSYERLWEQYSEEIVKAFHRQTGLGFTQKQITIRCTTDDTSYSGSRNHPMQLSINYTNDDERLSVLTHELAHRLLAGHGLRVESQNENKAILKGHKRMYLFLYDVWVDAFGESKAAELRKYELEAISGKDNLPFQRAWKWAFSKSYAERQAAISNLIAES